LIIEGRERDMTSVGYTVPANYTAGSDTSQGASKNRNPNDPNMLTTGAYGNAFALALDTAIGSDGRTTDTLTYKSYAGKANGSFSATSETGSGGDLATTFQSLLSTMQANGEITDATSAQLKDAYGQLNDKSQGGSTDATASGGGMLVVVGGPVQFTGISAYQNKFVDSIIDDLSSNLWHDAIV
jgi:hypothetical protein